MQRCGSAKRDPRGTTLRPTGGRTRGWLRAIPGLAGWVRGRGGAVAHQLHPPWGGASRVIFSRGTHGSILCKLCGKLTNPPGPSCFDGRMAKVRLANHTYSPSLWQSDPLDKSWETDQVGGDGLVPATLAVCRASHLHTRFALSPAENTALSRCDGPALSRRAGHLRRVP